MIARLLLCLFLLAAGAAEAREEILSFHSDIEVLADASMTVTETIRVRAEGAEIRRGIYRDFPTDYRDRLGNRYRVGFEVLDVRRNGTAEDYHSERQGNGVRVYIGHPDRLLAPGEYTYALTYRTTRQLGFFDAHDELYWNVTGNDWVFPILEASAEVRLPASVPFDAVSAEGYTGPRGAQGQDYRARVDPDEAVRFAATRALAPGEGLTIVVTWPKGHVEAPGAAENLGYLIRDNAPYLVGIVGLCVLLVYYLAAWHRHGRDPEAGVIVPLYEPPAGYSPASMRFIRRMGYDHKTFAAALVNLAVKGLVEIDDSGSDVVVTRTGKEAAGLAPGEKALINALFVSTAPHAHTSAQLEQLLASLPAKQDSIAMVPRMLVGMLKDRLTAAGSGTSAHATDGSAASGSQLDRVVLERKNHSRIRAALSAHESALRRDYDKVYFRTNRGWMVPGAAITLAMLAAAAWTLAPAEREVSLFMSLWLSFWSVGVVVLLRNAWRAWRGASSVLEWIGALFASAFAIPFVAGEVVGIYVLFTQGSPALPFVLLAALAVNLAFFQLLKAPSRAGRQLLDKAEGFRLFLDVAEKDELNLRNPPQKTPELFERYLPYALALDVENRWAERFAGQFARLEDEGRAYRPSWYRGSRFSPSRMGAFSSAIGNSLGSAIAAAATAPGKSSGSGGGGSSGGGGGGGGGGGW